MSNLKRIAQKMGWDRDKVIELTDRWLSAQHRADETFDGFLRAIAHEELVAKDAVRTHDVHFCIEMHGYYRCEVGDADDAIEAFLECGLDDMMGMAEPRKLRIYEVCDEIGENTPVSREKELG